MQICDAESINILKGVVSKDHIHIHIEYHLSQDISSIVKKLKGRSSRRLQQDFLKLHKRYWGRDFWAMGFRCWSRSNITDKMVNEYLEHHRKSNNYTDSFILE